MATEKTLTLGPEREERGIEDATLTPGGLLGQRTNLTVAQEFIGTFSGGEGESADEQAEMALAAWMCRFQRFPDVWSISDDGSEHLISAAFYDRHRVVYWSVRAGLSYREADNGDV